MSPVASAKVLSPVHQCMGWGSCAAAGWHVLETAVNCLMVNPQPDCDALGQLYLDCILLLQAKEEDGQAAKLWQQAIVTLHRQAAGITQEQSRATFLTGITAHQRLFTLDLSRNPRRR